MSNATQELKQFNEAMMQTTMQAVSTALWAQEQADHLVRACLDSQKSTREEGKKLAEKMAEQVKANQENLQRFIHSSVSLSLASMRIPQPGQVEELNRKVEALTKELEAIKKTK
ncbi:MAG: hypothetical protein AMXMBFR33_64190 [Candidatus Xenobia bacterium]|jgi:polyhydroxyalkanoate synthesis regulator phasin